MNNHKGEEREKLATAKGSRSTGGASFRQCLPKTQSFSTPFSYQLLHITTIPQPLFTNTSFVSRVFLLSRVNIIATGTVTTGSATIPLSGSSGRGQA